MLSSGQQQQQQQPDTSSLSTSRSAFIRLLWLPINNDVLSFDRRVVQNPAKLVSLTWLLLLVSAALSLVYIDAQQKSTVLVSKTSSGITADSVGCVQPTLTRDKVRGLMSRWSQNTDLWEDPSLPAGDQGPPGCVYGPSSTDNFTQAWSVLPNFKEIRSFVCFSDLSDTTCGHNSQVIDLAAVWTPNASLDCLGGFKLGDIDYTSTPQVCLNTYAPWVNFDQGTTDLSEYGRGFATVDTTVWPTSRPLVDFFDMVTSGLDPKITLHRVMPILVSGYSSSAGFDQVVSLEVHFSPIFSGGIPLNDVVLRGRRKLSDLFASESAFNNAPRTTGFGAIQSDLQSKYGQVTTYIRGDTYVNEYPLWFLGRCWRFAEQRVVGTVCFKEDTQDALSSIAKGASLFLSSLGIIACMTKCCVRRYSDPEALQDEFGRSTGIQSPAREGPKRDVDVELPTISVSPSGVPALPKKATIDDHA